MLALFMTAEDLSMTFSDPGSQSGSKPILCLLASSLLVFSTANFAKRYATLNHFTL
jgi:hypothetical protein